MPRDHAPLLPDSAAGLEKILRPRSVAVVGASRRANTVGHNIVANLIAHGFSGPVYPVNPSARAIRSVRAYPGIADVPEPVDLAVIAVPKENVLAVASECIEARVGGLVVITAGFREVGPEGARREAELAALVRAAGIRLVGPNCMGVLNTHPELSLNATFAPVMPPAGDVAFMSQSGALGLSVLDYANEYGIGIGQFVSLGNKPDVSGNDLLLYWESDPSVRVILMYAENFGNPRNFLEIARRVTASKPLIVMKSGRSQIGARAAASHTGSLAASDAAVDAVLQQAGALRAGSIEELFDMAIAFGVRALPASRRTAVVTNAGGPGILLADAMETVGMDLVELSQGTTERLRGAFPEEASIRNPLDMIATATPANYRFALETILHDPVVDAAVAVFVPPVGVRQEDVAEAIVEAASSQPDKPVVAVLMGRDGLPQGRAELRPAAIPAYIFPESAARALAALARYRERLERPQQDYPRVSVDRDAAASLIASARKRGAARLSELEALALLKAYGIATVGAELARSAEEAAALWSERSVPVAMKIVSPDVMHKTDVGGVVLNVRSAAEAGQAFASITQAVLKARPDAGLDGVLLQPMAAPGREMIAGISREPSFGPLIMFGLGGIYVEALRDVIFRVAPLGTRDAEEMISGIRSSAILTSIRGKPAADRSRIADVLLRLSSLALDCPEITELDINPLLVSETGAMAADCRVSLAVDD